MTAMTFESHAYVRDGLCARCGAAPNGPCVAEPFAAMHRSSDASWAEQTTIDADLTNGLGAPLKCTGQGCDAGSLSGGRRCPRCLGWGVEPHAVYDAIASRFVDATKRSDACDADLSNGHGEAGEVVALKAEIQRLHDILGRAGVSFKADAPLPEKDAFPARALREQPRQIGLRSP